MRAAAFFAAGLEAAGLAEAEVLDPAVALLRAEPLAGGLADDFFATDFDADLAADFVAVFDVLFAAALVAAFPAAFAAAFAGDFAAAFFAVFEADFAADFVADLPAALAGVLALSAPAFDVAFFAAALPVFFTADLAAGGGSVETGLSTAASVAGVVRRGVAPDPDAAAFCAEGAEGLSCAGGRGGLSFRAASSASRISFSPSSGEIWPRRIMY